MRAGREPKPTRPAQPRSTYRSLRAGRCARLGVRNSSGSRRSSEPKARTAVVWSLRIDELSSVIMHPMGGQTSRFIIFVLIASAVLTLPVAAALLSLYRRSVRTGMMTGGPDSEAPHPSVPAAAHSPIRIIDHDGDPPEYAEHPLRAAVTIYGAAGLAFALLFATGWGLQSNDGKWEWLHILTLAITLATVNFWPAVLAIELVAATSRRERLSIAAGYFLAFAVIGAGALAVSSKLTASQL